MINHASITVPANVQVKQSRGHDAQSNHETNHANHGICIGAGQAITHQSRSITRRSITEPPTPLGVVPVDHDRAKARHEGHSFTSADLSRGVH